MNLRIRVIGPGLHRNEVVAAIAGSSGEERVLIDKRSISAEETIEVGAPIKFDGKRFLVELPRETMTGAWRVWVPARDIKKSAYAA